MRSYRGTIDTIGPVVRIAVGPSELLSQSRAHRGVPAIEPYATRGIVDTGASLTLVDPNVLGTLGLPTSSVALLQRVSPNPKAGQPPRRATIDTFDVGLTIGLDDGDSFHVRQIRIGAARVHHMGFDVLIGRDVLAMATFAYDGVAGTFRLSFP